MDFAKTYDKIRTRIIIRNFFIGSLSLFLVFIVCNFFEIMEKESLSHMIVLSINQGFIMMFMGYNIFQRNDFSKSFKRLSVDFPQINDAVFYAILFSRLNKSKYIEKPELAIKKIKRVYFSLFLKSPEMKEDEVKKILEYLNQ